MKKIKGAVLVALFLVVVLLAATRETKAADFDLQLNHYSNAGSAAPNMGQDVVNLCYRMPRLRFCAGLPLASGEYSEGWAVSLSEDIGMYRIGLGYVSQQKFHTSRDGIIPAGENMFGHVHACPRQSKKTLRQ